MKTRIKNFVNSLRIFVDLRPRRGFCQLRRYIGVSLLSGVILRAALGSAKLPGSGKATSSDWRLLITRILKSRLPAASVTTARCLLPMAYPDNADRADHDRSRQIVTIQSVNTRTVGDKLRLCGYSSDTGVGACRPSASTSRNWPDARWSATRYRASWISP